jgi:histone-arginine methyltransferase CARM1
VAEKEFFSMPVVGTFSPVILMAHAMTPTCSHIIDFRTATIQELQEIFIPMRFVIGQTGVLHGIAGWFDCDFMPTRSASTMDLDTMGQTAITLSTHPAMPVTHWQQIRFVLRDPLALNQGDVLVGWMRLKTNAMRSYDIDAEVWAEDLQTSDHVRVNTHRQGRWDLHEQAYNYSAAYAGQQQGVGEDVMKEWAGLYTSASDSLQ